MLLEPTTGGSEPFANDDDDVGAECADGEDPLDVARALRPPECVPFAAFL